MAALHFLPYAPLRTWDDAPSLEFTRAAPLPLVRTRPSADQPASRRTAMAELPTGPQDVLTFARMLRARGQVAAAEQLLDATLGQPELLNSQAPEQLAPLGWLLLERADLWAERGALTHAHGLAERAQKSFEMAVDGGGAAAAALALGDLAWSQGQAGVAASHWARARAVADTVGASALAARALLALSIRELGGGDADVVEALLAAAEDRATAEPLHTDVVLEQLARDQSDTVRASIAVVRARQAMAAQRWAEARLLLGVAVEAAERLHHPELYIDCLRVDASLARRSGDPHGAVESLGLALHAAARAGHERLAWVLGGLQILAMLDDESDAAAATALQQEPPPLIAGLPAVAALRSEAYAVLALRSGQVAAAEPALLQAAELRRSMEDQAGEARVLALLAEALLQQGSWADADAIATRAAELALGIGRPELRVGPELAKLRAAVARDDPNQLQIALAAGQLAAACGSSAEQLVALDLAAVAALASRSFDLAIAAAAQAVELAESLPLLRWRARAEARLAHCLAMAGDLPKALRHADRAMQVADQAGDWQARAKALWVAGSALAESGRIDEARLALTHAHQTAVAAHRQDLAAEALAELGRCQARVHAFVEAESAYRQAAQAAAQCGQKACEVRAWRGVAWCARDTARFGEAKQVLAHAAGLAQQAGLQGDVAACRVELGQVHLRAGDLDLALAAVRLPEAQTLPPLVRADALLLAAEVRARRGQWSEARTLAVQAEELLRAASEPRSLGAALYLLGQIEGRLGAGERAGQLLGEALVLATQQGLPEQQVIRRTIERMQQQAAPTQH